MDLISLSFFIFLVLVVVKDVNSIECYDCSGSHTYCNNTRTTKTCTGPQYSCLLRFGSTRIRIIKNGALDYDSLTTVTKTCAVESSSYCAKQKGVDPKMISCEAIWCYTDGCNFDLKKATNNAGQKTSKSKSNKVDPYGWYRSSSSTTAKCFHNRTHLFTLVVLIALIFLR